MSVIQKWGNSLGVRIPKVIAERLKLAEGVSVEMETKGDALILRPARRRKYTLDELVSKITPANRPGEWDDSAPVGREVI